MNNTDVLKPAVTAPLALDVLAHHTRAAADAFIAAGTAANTVRSYQSALAYWPAWLRLRYDRAHGDGALPAEVAVQFIVDHLARPTADAGWSHLQPARAEDAIAP